MVKYKLIILHSLPFVLGICLSYFFSQNNGALLLIYLAVTALVVLLGKDKKTESYIFIYGLVAGSIIEVLGTSVSKYQSFTNPQFYGIPFWLPVTWGYGFILMKRVSLIIAKNSPWA